MVKVAHNKDELKRKILKYVRREARGYLKARGEDCEIRHITAGEELSDLEKKATPKTFLSSLVWD